MNQTFENERRPRTQEETENRREARPRTRINVENVKRLAETGRRLGNEAMGHARRRPQLAIGVALATGFVAGSIFGSRLGQVMLASAAGYLVKHALSGDSALEEIRLSLERLVDGTRRGDRAEGEAPAPRT
jgi:hypothetical protein